MALKADDAGVIVACPACEQPNRIRFGKLDAQARCARCKQSIPFVSLPVEIDSPAWASCVEDETFPAGETDDLQRWLDLNA